MNSTLCVASIFHIFNVYNKFQFSIAPLHCLAMNVAFKRLSMGKKQQQKTHLSKSTVHASRMSCAQNNVVHTLYKTIINSPFKTKYLWVSDGSMIQYHQCVCFITWALNMIFNQSLWGENKSTRAIVVHDQHTYSLYDIRRALLIYCHLIIIIVLCLL